MYARYAERQGWKMEIMDASDTGVGGIKEAIAMIEGDNVYSKMRYESGVHRVQRVPQTETQRAHSHVGDHGRRPARGRRGRRSDQSERSSHRHVLLVRSRRPVGEHDLFRRAHHASADKRRRFDAGRKIADQEPRKGDARSCVRGCRNSKSKNSTTRCRPNANRWSAAATARKRFAHTISRKIASPITASA